MAINDLMYRFSGNPNPSPDVNAGKDMDLEKMIDEVGRKEVFARAKKLGWSNGEIPPKWVWYAICADIKHGRASLKKYYSLGPAS